MDFTTASDIVWDLTQEAAANKDQLATYHVDIATAAGGQQRLSGRRIEVVPNPAGEDGPLVFLNTVHHEQGYTDSRRITIALRYVTAISVSHHQ